MKKKTLVNPFERAAQAALERAAKRHGAKVFCKVPLDQLIDSYIVFRQRGMEREKLELDFVVSTHLSILDFALQYDGPGHHLDRRQAAVDLYFNDCCRQGGVPLFRVDARHLMIGQERSVLVKIIDLWYETEKEECRLEAGDPDHLQTIAQEFSGEALKTEVDYVIDNMGYTVAKVMLHLKGQPMLIGLGRCLVPPQFAEFGQNLALELAMIDADNRMRMFN